MAGVHGSFNEGSTSGAWMENGRAGQRPWPQQQQPHSLNAGHQSVAKPRPGCMNQKQCAVGPPVRRDKQGKQGAREVSGQHRAIAAD